MLPTIAVDFQRRRRPVMLLLLSLPLRVHRPRLRVNPLLLPWMPAAAVARDRLLCDPCPFGKEALVECGVPRRGGGGLGAPPLGAREAPLPETGGAAVGGGRSLGVEDVVGLGRVRA